MKPTHALAVRQLIRFSAGLLVAAVLGGTVAAAPALAATCSTPAATTAPAFATGPASVPLTRTSGLQTISLELRVTPAAPTEFSVYYLRPDGTIRYGLLAGTSCDGTITAYYQEAAPFAGLTVVFEAKNAFGTTRSTDPRPTDAPTWVQVQEDFVLPGERGFRAQTLVVSPAVATKFTLLVTRDNGDIVYALDLGLSEDGTLPVRFALSPDYWGLHLRYVATNTNGSTRSDGLPFG